VSRAAHIPLAGVRGRRRRPAAVGGVGPLGLGVATLWLSLIVLLPLAALATRSLDGGVGGLWDAVSAPQARAALELTVGISLIVALVNVVAGTLIAWVLVRDEFRGKRFANALIDLPFALPTIVASIVLLALYGPRSPIGLHLYATRPALVIALAFVTLPFVVRSVQPVLIEADREAEQAAASLGAGNWTIFRRIILPSLGPALLGGAGLAFARAIGEFGSIVLISGNIPFKTEVGSVYVFNQIENDNVPAAAAVSMVLLAAALLVVALLNLFGRRRFTYAR
jgi:sulfate/thiosulfate transport system permease protein